MKFRTSNPLLSRICSGFSPLVAVALVLCGSGIAAAQTISVNFGGDRAQVSNPVKTAGATPVAGIHWNNATTASGVLSSLKDSTGAVTTGSVTWSSQNTYFSSSTGSTATSENGSLTKGYLDDSGTGWTVKINSPYLLSDIHVIHASDQSNPVEVSAVSVNDVFYKGDGAGGTMVARGSGDSWSALNFSTADTLVESSNFIKVGGQQAVSLAGFSASPGRSAIAGVQITNAYAGAMRYFDLNGSTPGAGIPDTGGAWSDMNWSSSSAGDSATESWTSGAAAVFSAGTERNGGFVVTLAQEETADSVWSRGGTVFLSGGSLRLTGNSILRSDEETGGLDLDSKVIASNPVVVGGVSFSNALNEISGTLSIHGVVRVAADQSWPQISGPGRIEVLSGKQVTIGGGDLSSVYDGTFEGFGSLVKDGAGDLTLTRSNPNFRNNFEIRNGSLTFSNAKGSYNTAMSFTGSGDLRFKGSGASNPQLGIDSDNSGFTGTVTVDGARVLVDDTKDLGSGVVSVLPGGQVFVTGGAISNNYEIQGVGTSESAGNLGALRVEGGANLSGSVTLLGNSRIAVWNAGEGTISGPLVGAFDLEKTGTGTLSLTSVNNTGFTGKVVSDAGVLSIPDQTTLGDAPAVLSPDAITLRNNGKLRSQDQSLVLDATRGIRLGGANGGFDVTAGTAIVCNGPVDGPGNLVKTGLGSLTHNGDVAIDGGYVGSAGEAIFKGDFVLGPDKAFRVDNNAVSVLECPAFVFPAGMDLYSGITHITAGSGIVDDIEMGQGYGQSHVIHHTAGRLDVATDVRIGHYPDETSTYNISGGSLNQPDTVTNTGAENQANLFIGIDGSGILNISGTGVVNTSSLVVNGRGEGNHAGEDALNLTGGRLNLGQHGMRTHGSTYAVNLGGGIVGASANWSSSLSMTLSGINGATTFDTSDAVDGATARTITLSGVLSGASGGILKTGLGNLVLSGSNTYEGGTVVSQGAVVVQGAGALGSGPITLGGESTATFDVALYAQSASSGDLAFTRSFTVANQGTGSVIIGTSRTGSGRTFYDGEITLQRDVTLSGTLDDRTMYRGGIRGTGNIRVAGGSRTTLGDDPTVTEGGEGPSVYDFAGNLTLAGAGTLLQFNSDIELMNVPAVMVEEGTTLRSAYGKTLRINALAGEGTVTSVAGSGTLVVGINHGSGNFAGVLSGGGGDALNLTKLGSGTQTLSGTNSYTGATTINGGTLALGASHTLPDTTAVAIGAATLDAATFTNTTGTLRTSGAACIHLGVGSSLAFANSQAVEWSGSLHITGPFVSGASLRFGRDADGLSRGQLAKITVQDQPGLVLSLDASGYLIAMPGSDYDSWASQITNGLNGRHDDADGDGFTNLQEFLFGKNPMASDGSLSTSEVVAGTLVIHWKERTLGASYTLQHSETLADDWLPTSASLISNEGQPVDNYQAKVAVIQITGNKRFFRIQGVEN